jgi:hypothetical protein
MLHQKILSFLFSLKFTAQLPEGFDVLNPFNDEETKRVCNEFYSKYYNDNLVRYCIIGINPGRFGAGITGVPFTDPIRLQSKLHIDNKWPKKQELSSVFIYDMIEAYGGVENFYRTFYITAVSPLGFIKDGKNINYYDDKKLQEIVTPFAVECLHKQLSWSLHNSVAFCLGEGKNYNFINKLNNQYHFFEKIIPLSHPRFIMQYKLKQKASYIQQYLHAFQATISTHS